MVSRAHTAGVRFMPDKNDAEETARVYQEFIETFQNVPQPGSQSWVRGGVVNPDAKNIKADSSKIYKPVSRFEPVTKPKTENKLTSETPPRPVIKKKEEKKKSNLELFKEELKRMQEQRELKNQNKSGKGDVLGLINPDCAVMELDTDLVTTNLFVGNLHKSTTEQDLVDSFGRYGALASVKIMAPRPEENKPFVKNCGFVAYMNRPDCERAMTRLRGKDLNGNELKIGWGKPVTMPAYPIFVPETLHELLKPSQPSGLPFNAQPRDWLESEYRSLVDRIKLVKSGSSSSLMPPTPRKPYDTRSMSRSEMTELLKNCVVRVTIPTDRALLILIHRTIEFVVLEGPEFEAAIIHKEQNNPIYRFLYDYNCPEHVYYRWKLWSILHGEASNSWCTDEFKMFLSGPWWRPPPLDFFSTPMPEELIIPDKLDYSPNFSKSDPLYTMYDAERDRQSAINQANTILSDSRKKKLIKLLKTIEPTVNGIGRVMLWCLQHAESAEDITEIILKSLDPNGFDDDDKLVTMPILVGRIYLISDILYNSCAKAFNASAYRRILERHLPAMFSFLNKHYCILLDESQRIKLKADQLKQKVLLCLRAWHDWAIYPNEFLHNLRVTFLGSNKSDSDDVKDGKTTPPIPEEPVEKKARSNPLVQYDDDDEDADVDGKPLDMKSPKKSTNKSDSEDSDGVPLDISQPIGTKIGFNPLAPQPSNPKASNSSSLFIKSKWETLDDETVESETLSQANRWKLFDSNESKTAKSSPANSNDDVDGQPLNSSEFNLVAYDDDDISSGPDDVDGKPLSANNLLQKKELEIDREKLRDIELQVLKYQDELEHSRRNNPSKTLASIEEQVRKYRSQLIDSAMKKTQEKTDGKSLNSRKRDKNSNDEYSSDESRKRTHRSSSRSSSSRNHKNGKSRKR